MPRWSRDVLDAPHTVREFEQLDFEMYEHVRIVGESLQGSQAASTEPA